MSFSKYRRLFLENPSYYLPFLYPVIMPIITLFSFKIPVQTSEEVLKYWVFTGFLHFLLVLVVRKAVYSTAYNVFVKWFIACLVCYLIILVYVFLEFNFFHFIVHLLHPNEWKNIARYTVNIPVLVALIGGFKSVTDRNKIMMDNIDLENENAKAQLNLLLQQINPHFLFNSLSVLQSMVRSKDNRTDEYIVKLGDVFQKTLKTDNKTVTLKEELDFFNAYMYLMTLRQENAIFIEIQVADASLAYNLPAFSLQLLAENCIKHNIVSKARPLYIRLHQKNAKTLTISNNYQPKTARSESFGIGLDNLKKRYALEGITQGIQIEQNDKDYSTTIKLF